MLGSRARILTGRCPAYGDGVTFWPLREVVVEGAGGARVDSLAEILSGEADGEGVAAQIGAAIGLTQEPTRPDELFPAIRRFFEAVANRRPLVVVLEDVHWAEATFLDLIEYLADAAREPLVLLCLARPELLEVRPAWGAGSRNVGMLVLEPLRESEIQLIADRLAGGALLPEMRARVVQTAQGNPLFAEQLVALSGLRDAAGRARGAASGVPARAPRGAPGPTGTGGAGFAAMRRRDRNVVHG